MNFNNPDPTKQAHKMFENFKIPCLIFNHNVVSLTKSEKHLGIVLDCKFDFKDHPEIIIQKVSKTIRPLQNLPRKSLIAAYKSFRRPQFDYGDIMTTSFMHLFIGI